MYCRMGKTRVSSWRWWIGVELVQPVAIRSGDFFGHLEVIHVGVSCVGCQEGCAYEWIGLIYFLYTCVISSLECPKDLFVFLISIS